MALKLDTISSERIPLLASSTIRSRSSTMPMPMSTTLPLTETHPEISIAIPNHHDNQHIDKMMNFEHLLKRVGNTVYGTIPSPRAMEELKPIPVESTITHEQLAKSVVLDMTDAHETTFQNDLERLFGITDMHTIINYLWIAVVATLIVLSIIFTVLSCYFYRKFRAWKKCNKDIRSNLGTDGIYTETVAPFNSPNDSAALYCQMESPPCYTIATGLPTYDEAIHHHNHHHNHNEYEHDYHYKHHYYDYKNNSNVIMEKGQRQAPHTYGFRFICPNLKSLHERARNRYDKSQTKEGPVSKTLSIKPEAKANDSTTDYAASNIALLIDCANRSSHGSHGSSSVTSPVSSQAVNASMHSVLNGGENFNTIYLK